MFSMLSRVSTSTLFERSFLQPSNERVARVLPNQARIELRQVFNPQERTAQALRVRVVLPVETGGAQAASPAAAPGAGIEPAAIASMLADLGNPAAFADPTLARTALGSLQTLASVYGGEGSGRVYDAIAHWMQIAGGLARVGASTTSAPAAAPPPSVPPASAPATQSTPRSQESTHNLATTSVPYDQLPARMKGGISSGNGMPIIIVRDASELAALPMWREGMHPAAAQSYYDRLAEALRNEHGSVMGFAGYEIEIVGTNGAERSAETSSAKPWVSNAEIAAFVKANLGSPEKIADAMKQYGVSFDRIQEATGYTRRQIVDYVMASSCQPLIALL